MRERRRETGRDGNRERECERESGRGNETRYEVGIIMPPNLLEETPPSWPAGRYSPPAATDE